jgi:superfamily II DNA or RNA helicase
VIKVDRLIWVPYSKKLARAFTKKIYITSKCERCPYLEDRHSENCDNCPNYLGKFPVYERNGDMLGLPKGDRAKLKKYVAFDDVKDKRASTNRRFEITFDESLLMDSQRNAVNDMVQYSYGLLDAPPRSGKTAIMLAIGLRHPFKILIIAHQYDLLKQFMNEADKFTDIRDVEKFNRTKLIGICGKLEDFVKYDICLITYQSLLFDKGTDLIPKIKDMFGIIMVDEVHKSGAERYNQILMQFNSKILIGCTGTVERKDNKHHLVNMVVGPTKHTMFAATLNSSGRIIMTGRKYERSNAWATAIRRISVDSVRNKMIVRHAAQYMNSRYVLIPVTLKKHGQLLTDELNKLIPGSTAFYNGSLSKQAKDELLAKARSGELRCVIAMRQMLLGINVPIWDTLLEIIPSANQPNFEQELKRVFTHMPGKKPIVDFFIDNGGPSRSCYFICLPVLEKNHVKINGARDLYRPSYQSAIPDGETIISRTDYSRPF